MIVENVRRAYINSMTKYIVVADYIDMIVHYSFLKEENARGCKSTTFIAGMWKKKQNPKKIPQNN